MNRPSVSHPLIMSVCGEFSYYGERPRIVWMEIWTTKEFFALLIVLYYSHTYFALIHRHGISKACGLYEMMPMIKITLYVSGSMAKCVWLNSLFIQRMAWKIGKSRSSNGFHWVICHCFIPGVYRLASILSSFYYTPFMLQKVHYIFGSKRDVPLHEQRLFGKK